MNAITIKYTKINENGKYESLIINRYFASEADMMCFAARTFGVIVRMFVFAG